VATTGEIVLNISPGAKLREPDARMVSKELLGLVPPTTDQSTVTVLELKLLRRTVKLLGNAEVSLCAAA
jgi:hypothetical protein